MKRRMSVLLQRLKCSLSLKKNARPRFKEVNEDVFQELSKPHSMSLNTDKVGDEEFNRLVYIIYNDYNKRNPENPCPEEIVLPNCSAEKLNECLCVYVAETRSHSGRPVSTCYALLSLVWYAPAHEERKSFIPKIF